MENKVFDVVYDLIGKVQKEEKENIQKVAVAFADCIQNGGIIQAFGAGHSNAGALELTHRAGGFIPTKNIKEPAGGAYESIEGVGTSFMKKVDVRENDVVVIISNSGRNPLPIEIALGAKQKGATVVAVTALEASKTLKSKHSCGKNLYEIADIVLDNKIIVGDSTIDVEGLETKVCGMSTVTTSVLLQAVTLEAVNVLSARGIKAPIYQSQNVDGGREYNENLEKAYIDRLYRI
ncbi:SIS domain-containing protein [Anaerorhabdus sp.]|uniref:SIS domain-containing protein n=1 Tax=Anaerorhabdus sp. TaxID=1872524 RepID=UPI002FCBA7A4